ncbi:TatD family hydrolase [Olivibacter ginsenosidimutans]|uniref:TatD family hydrolase n=1 Tax=Olivibacter ginsenosidimutans TaxID=1176537 RepID=A0ABP9AXY7_9SPHI
MPTYIDIHTHQLISEADICIYNLRQQYQTQYLYPYCSIGIHPWDITLASWKQQLDELKHYASLSPVAAIGECGLDKLCSVDWQLQCTIFAAQVSLANWVKKPLIIHCVKAFEEVMAILKTEKNQVPVIFHGFNKKQTLAAMLTKKGYYLSFGGAILKDQHTDSLLSCPLTQLFFETDNNQYSIHQVYEKAASLLNIPQAILLEEVEHNFNKIITS